MTTILVDSKQIQNLEDEIGALTAECDAMRAELELLRANAATDEILLGAAQAAAQRLGTRCEALRAGLEIANAILKAKMKNSTAGAQPDTKELVQAEHSRLEAQTATEYASSLVSYNNTRIPGDDEDTTLSVARPWTAPEHSGRTGETNEDQNSRGH